MQDDPSSHPRPDVREIDDVQEWMDKKHHPYALVFGEPSGTLSHALREASCILNRAATLNEVPKERRRAWHRLSWRVKRLLRMPDDVKRAFTELFGEMSLREDAQFMRRLWRKIRHFVHDAAQHYTNRTPFYLGAPSQRRRFVHEQVIFAH